MDRLEQLCHDACLLRIYFLAYSRLPTVFGREEETTVFHEQMAQGRQGLLSGGGHGWVDGVLQLVGQRDAEKVFALVEPTVGEVGYLWMHAPLATQDADEIGSFGCSFRIDEPLEERVAAVGKLDVLEDGLLYD